MRTFETAMHEYGDGFWEHCDRWHAQREGLASTLTDDEFVEFKSWVARNARYYDYLSGWSDLAEEFISERSHG